MNTWIERTFIVIAAAGLVGGAGCSVKVEAKPLTKYVGTQETRDIAWVSGQPLRVENTNGEIQIKTGGDASNVVVQAKPFTMAEDKEKGVSEMESKLSLDTSTDGSGNILVKGNKTGGVYPGWDITVLVPAGFDAPLAVNSNNGGIDVFGLFGALSADITQNNGSVYAEVGNASVNLFSDNGSVTVVVGGGGAGTITTDNGSITLEIPASSDTSIKAQAEGSVVLEPAGIPSGWQELVASESSKTYVCNGAGSGREYSLQAGGTSLADAVITPTY